MNKGITVAGIEKMIPSANTPANPTNPYAREKIKGVMIALIWKVAVLDVTACIRCDSGTTLAVMADLAQEKVTVERARKAYGVVVDTETMALDVTATERLREQMRRDRGELPLEPQVVRAVEA